VASIAAISSPGSGDPVYGRRQAGIVGMTRAFAAEFRSARHFPPTRSRPAFRHETKPRHRDRPVVSQEFARRVPLGRWGRPDEIAGTAVFFSGSDAASFVTATSSSSMAAPRVLARDREHGGAAIDDDDVAVDEGGGVRSQKNGSPAICRDRPQRPSGTRRANSCETTGSVAMARLVSVAKKNRARSRWR